MNKRAAQLNHPYPGDVKVTDEEFDDVSVEHLPDRYTWLD